jgi:MFS family permease
VSDSSPEDLITYLIREWRFTLATFAASGIGYLGSAAAPVIVQALLDAGLSHQRAGDLGTIELTTLAATSFLSTPFVPRISHRWLALSGTLLAAFGVAISAFADAYAVMILGRLFIGTGSGLAIAGANATISAREDAERVFAIIWTLGGGITAFIAITMPVVVEGGNYPAGFGMLLILALAAAPFVLWIPHRPPAFEREDSITTVPATGDLAGPPETESFGSSLPPTSLLDPLALLTLGGIFLYSLAEMALWQFAFDIAVENGIPYERVGYFIGVTGFVGLTGGFVAAWIGLRFRRVVPVVVGSLISVAGRWLALGNRLLLRGAVSDRPGRRARPPRAHRSGRHRLHQPGLRTGSQPRRAHPPVPGRQRSRPHHPGGRRRRRNVRVDAAAVAGGPAPGPADLRAWQVASRPTGAGSAERSGPRLR